MVQNVITPEQSKINEKQEYGDTEPVGMERDLLEEIEGLERYVVDIDGDEFLANSVEEVAKMLEGVRTIEGSFEKPEDQFYPSSRIHSEESIGGLVYQKFMEDDELLKEVKIKEPVY